MFKPLVLIVDDDVNILRVMRKKLSDAGYDIIEAKNGIESIEQAAKHSPEIIVMDISMPKLDGIGAILK
ncbi:MAG: response regulator, partial [Candidatus Omnitrophota bacterium]